MLNRKKGGKVNNSGRNESERFIKLTYHMLGSEAFRSLSGGAIKVWIELRSRFNGGNNGKICLSMEQASKLLGMSKSTVKRAYDELREKGFIKLRKKGHWYGRQANEWEVTDKGHQGHLSTNDWKLWRKTKNRK